MSLCALIAVSAACGDDDPASPDAGVDAGPGGVTLEHCEFVPVEPNANATGTVTAGALTAGAGEAILDVPIGAALGGYTSRASAAGRAGVIDDRDARISDGFLPSVGIESAPRAKAIALSAGGETIVIVKIDAIFTYEGLLYALEERLGAAYRGKVIVTSSHSHSAWMQYSDHDVLKGGGGNFRARVFDGVVDGMEAAARDALDALEPARLGFHVDAAFDPTDVINRDRRGENDDLPGGDRGDDRLVMMRVETTGGAPIAMMIVYGEHGTLMGDVNPLASNDAPGGIERVLEEQFDDPVVVMHVQSAGGDTSPVGHGGIDCDLHPGDTADDPCLPFPSIEGHGRVAAPTLLAAWDAAGAALDDTLEIEMVTRSVELGPWHDTYTIRDGALAYAPWDLSREADGVVFDGDTLASPVDEFNAPVGAVLCETAEATFPVGAMPGTQGIIAYGGCTRIDVASEILGALLRLETEVDATHPACQTTRTNLAALRIGDYVIGTIPGEMTVPIADLVRDRSPVDDAHTIAIGYAQGHVGYVLTPEDWSRGGYEPSITFWGPLEGEYLVEQLAELMPLVMTPARDDGAAGGTDRVGVPGDPDDFPIDDPAPSAGTVPASIDPDVWVRSGTPATAQPAAQIPRVSGIATFVFLGDDPAVTLPVVTLQRETSPGGGVYADVTRRSGRVVRDTDLLLEYTPLPLRRDGDEPVTHAYAVEWQAVPWLGAVGLDSVDDRGGVPLGRYRFHVVGDGWTLDSSAFEVIAGGLELSASRAGTVLTATPSWHAPDGYRLMDLASPSNRPVPVRNASVTVELLNAGGTAIDTRTVTTAANGQLSFDDADVATAVTVRVTDEFGNVASRAL